MFAQKWRAAHACLFTFIGGLRGWDGKQAPRQYANVGGLCTDLGCELLARTLCTLSHQLHDDDHLILGKQIGHLRADKHALGLQVRHNLGTVSATARAAMTRPGS